VKQVRALVAGLAGFFLLFTIGGVLLMYVGEWLARRQLPPEMQTAKAIQTHFDGAVCLACDLGGILILMGLSLAIVILLAWSLVEFARTCSKG
jgi:hypothetical protein